MPHREEGPRPQLSVVLSTLGMHDALRRVLDGYADQDAPHGSFELVVAMDRAEADPDAVDAAIGDRGYAVRRITGPSPGASANRNAGWRSARAPLVLFTDNDTIPVRQLVSEHLAWHARNPENEVAILGHVRWASELKVTTFMRWLDQGIQFDYPSIEGIEAGWGRFYTANSSVKKRFIERVGDFDQEHLPYGYEDLDWAYRASKLEFRLLYNRAAVVDHLRPMTLEFWKRRVRRLAVAERQLVRLHPELKPYYFTMFSSVMEARPASGRGVKLERYIPRWVPLLGPRVWCSMDLAYKRALAPDFLEAWDEAAADEDGSAQPDLSERGAEGSPSEPERGSQPSGSMPGGP